MWPQFARRIILMALCMGFPSCTSVPASNGKPPRVGMIFWELQSWETEGGRSRLTIWSDGRSEVMIVPDEYFRRKPDMLLPRDGWTVRNGKRGLYFIRINVFPEEVAREKVRQAMAAGIHRLKTFKPGYLDGSGTLVGVGIEGKLIQTVIPMFLDRDRGSVNHKRFIAVSKVLSDFDRLLMMSGIS